MELLKSNIEGLSKTLVRYDRLALLMVDDTVQKHEGKFLYVEREEDKFYVGTQSTEKKRTNREFELGQYLTMSMGITSFVRKYNKLGMTKALAESTPWLKELIESPYAQIEDVPELFAVNVKSYQHMYFSQIAKNKKLQKGGAFNIKTLSNEKIKVDKIGSGADLAVGNSIRSNMFWSTWVYNSFIEVNTFCNLELTKIYLTALRKRSDTTADRVRLNYLNDFVPLAVKFTGVDFVFLENEKEMLNETHLFHDALAVPNCTMSGGSLSKISKDSSSIEDSKTLYTTKGKFHKCMGVYPKIFNCHTHYAYMTVFYHLFFPTLFSSATDYIYLNVNTGQALSQTNYDRKLSRNEIDASEFLRQSQIEIILLEGVKKDNYTNFVSTPQIKDTVTKVAERLQIVQLQDLYI